MKWLRGKAGSEETGPRVVLKVEGMHCASCGLLIDDELEDVPGVQSSSTNVRKGRSTIHLTEDSAVEHAMLIEAVERAGYQATLLT
ncbi:heavy-metal-associated domain-containing protein [Streptomyces albicerus]|uniref:heavy-metal-associated domain-containing protein n=1 Tax=Streptomyces albicerus TaxID=2569859 RepID=UPI001CEC71C0|nr:cation transporter [Streptomyces albicerus]